MPDQPTDVRQRWRDAIHDPDVWARLEFHARGIGNAPPAALLVAALDRWDHADQRHKGRLLLNALGADPASAFVFQERECRRRREQEGGSNG